MAVNHTAVIAVLGVVFLAGLFDIASEARILGALMANHECCYIPGLLIRECIARTIGHVGFYECCCGADARFKDA